MRDENLTISVKNGPYQLRELFWFGHQQAFACIFGALLLAGMLLTRQWDFGTALSRQDFLFLYAVSLQLALIAFRLEHPKEIAVILAFHVLATFMEWFKTSPAIGSWQYPGEGAIFRVYQVPLFAGFLYSAVGSYIARAWRLLDFHFTNYPPVIATVVIAVLAYANFFTHHFIPDFRWPLIIATGVLFAKTRIFFRTGQRYRSMPLLLGLSLVAFAIWIAENCGTYARAWLYPGQENGWSLVSLQKFWAWFLLMMLSFVLVSLLHLKNDKNKA